MLTSSCSDFDNRSSDVGDKGQVIGSEERIWKGDMQDKTLVCIVPINIYSNVSFEDKMKTRGEQELILILIYFYIGNEHSIFQYI